MWTSMPPATGICWRSRRSTSSCPKFPRCGGLSECRKVANMPAIYYIPFAPHNVSSPLGTHASAHVCAHGAQLPGAEIPLAAPVLLDHHHPGED
ncbi:MAG TPA: hypothetical protein EYQ20_06900 [candidate division Zixibacteria bacterium]|nr:hypothetical protein [candidate division Zixibacteria bacterium]